ncbi:MAG: hypothetical protein Q9M91_01380 [Candidatus Dojkabacteria bacterium]|nr:hypothetical protein [Candidatus Dojkabacteria bacterium]MDQ7020476.1 hypothetical protein [Candidatus Dojkabacteria bacterium]
MKQKAECAETSYSGSQLNAAKRILTHMAMIGSALDDVTHDLILNGFIGMTRGLDKDLYEEIVTRQFCDAEGKLDRDKFKETDPRRTAEIPAFSPPSENNEVSYAEA